jgi:DNA-binding GntR family transcriptional regulator
LEGIQVPPSLREVALDSIKRAIMDNTLQPGEIINEGILAKSLGISKTPVHEALLDLAARGFVTLLPRKGVQINVLTLEDIKNLYEFRRAIETTIIRRITKNLSDDDIIQIEDVHGQALKATKKDDRLAYIKADRQFHHLLATLSCNTYMISALTNVRDLIDWMGMKALVRDQRIHEVNQEHIDLIEKLKKRDVSAAVKSMAQHILLTEKNVLAWKQEKSS